MNKTFSYSAPGEPQTATNFNDAHVIFFNTLKNSYSSKTATNIENMAERDLGALQLMNAIIDESIRAFNELKSTTEQTIQQASEDVKKRFDNLVGEAAAECQSLAKSTDK